MRYGEELQPSIHTIKLHLPTLTIHHGNKPVVPSMMDPVSYTILGCVSFYLCGQSAISSRPTGRSSSSPFSRAVRSLNLNCSSRIV